MENEIVKESVTISDNNNDNQDKDNEDKVYTNISSSSDNIPIKEESITISNNTSTLVPAPESAPLPAPVPAHVPAPAPAPIPVHVSVPTPVNDTDQKNVHFPPKQRSSLRVRRTTVTSQDDDSGDDSLPSNVMESKWCDNIERVLDKLRRNCTQLSSYHNYKYQYCKKNVVWFRIPIIILSGVNTFISVGISDHVPQNIVSIATSIISLICGIITSIEMLMKYQDKMENELDAHRSYYKLSIDIYKMISVDRKFRKTGGKDFLEEKFGEYEKLRSKCRPEEHTDLIFDLLGEMDELFVYNRKDNTWLHKNAVAPRDLGYKNYDDYDYVDDPFVKRNIFEKIFEYFKRNLQKDNLAAQSKRLQHEHANDISQEYLDGKRKKTKMAAKRRSETGDHYNQIDTGNSGFLGWFGGGRRKNSTWDDYLTDEEDYV